MQAGRIGLRPVTSLSSLVGELKGQSVPIARTKFRRTWADQQGIPTGIWNEVWEGIRIVESNRATVWEHYKEGIRQLMDYCHRNYRSKGINACVFGIDDGGESEIRYAVFVRTGFLREVPEDEDFKPRRNNAGKRHDKVRAK